MNPISVKPSFGFSYGLQAFASIGRQNIIAPLHYAQNMGGLESSGYYIPDDLLYTKEHDWIRIVTNSRVVMGITDYAVKMLNDVVYVSLPSVGTDISNMDVFGSVESIKAVSDLNAPVSGKIIKVNELLNSNPELVSQSPYQDGWIIEIQPSNLQAESGAFLNPRAYASFIRDMITEKE